MIRLHVLGLAVVAIVACGLAACASKSGPTGAKSVKKTLIVSKNGEYSVTTRVGTLHFDETNRAMLTAEGSGDGVDQFKKDWAEISGRPELTWKKCERGEVDGHTVMRMVGEAVKPGAPNYIYAVLSTLERLHGYRVDLSE